MLNQTIVSADVEKKDQSYEPLPFFYVYLINVQNWAHSLSRNKSAMVIVGAFIHYAENGEIDNRIYTRNVKIRRWKIIYENLTTLFG